MEEGADPIHLISSFISGGKDLEIRHDSVLLKIVSSRDA